MRPVNRKTQRACKSCKSTTDDVKIYSKSWPIIRNEYQKKASNACEENQMDRSAYYDCKAISCGFAAELLNFERLKRPIDDQAIENSVLLQENVGNKLFDYLSTVNNDGSVDLTNKVQTEQLEMDELFEKCAKLPKEWNIVQISQIYSGYNSCATKKDLYTSIAPIKITVLKHSLLNQTTERTFSILREMDSDSDGNTITTTNYNVSQLYQSYTAHMNTAAYPEFIINLSAQQSKLVCDMTNLLGPWLTLLTGQVKGSQGLEYEMKLIQQVNDFCDENEFNDEQRLMLSFFVRRMDLVTSDMIEFGSRCVANSYKEFKMITAFLAKLKPEKFKLFDYYPCILIIDEILDQMPWEMLLTSQEYTRMHSIYLVFELYERYKDDIKDGYYVTMADKGIAVINPDNDEKLGDMTKRMTGFFNENLPDWPRIEQKLPTLDEINEYLSNINLFVYSGHGTSLAFLSSYDFEDIKLRCIMLLFGCESLAMKPGGTICEATCASYVYFKIFGCPGILGTLTIVTDIWIDLMTIFLLTQWVLPKSKEHPKIEVCKNDNTKAKVDKIMNKNKGKRNANFLQLLCEIRNEVEINIRMRSALIYRGLPTMNVLQME